MGRRFNVTGFCNPQKHYMVNLDDRLSDREELLTPLTGLMEKKEAV